MSEAELGEATAPAMEGGEGSPPADAGPPDTPGDAPAPEAAEVAAAPAPADWREALPEDIRYAKGLESVADVESLAQQFLNQQYYLGNSIRIPSEHASEEDRQAFIEKLRQHAPEAAPPEIPEAYALPAEFDASQANEELLGAFSNWAKEANLTQAQHDQLMTGYVELETQKAQLAAEQKAADYEALHKEWGFAYGQKHAQAVRLAELTEAPPEMVEAVRNQTVRPEVLAWMANVAERIGAEGKAITEGQSRTEMTPQEARLQHAEIMSNKEHPYWTAMPGTPEREAANAEVMRLMARATGASGREVAASIGQQDTIGRSEADEVDAPGMLFQGRVG